MSKKTREPGDCDVGYGKPPVGSRFKKGQSGNPAGRRKKVTPGSGLPAGLSALDVAVLRAGERPADVTLGGEGRSETGIEAVVNGMLGAAIDGDMRAAKMFKESYAAADAERRRLTPKDQGGGISIELIKEFTEFMLFKRMSGTEKPSEANGGAAAQDETASCCTDPVVSDETKTSLSPEAAFVPLGYLPNELPADEAGGRELPILEQAISRDDTKPASASSAMSGEASAPGKPLLTTSASRRRRGEPLIQNTQPYSAGGWGTAPKHPGG